MNINKLQRAVKGIGLALSLVFGFVLLCGISVNAQYRDNGDYRQNRQDNDRQDNRQYNRQGVRRDDRHDRPDD